MDYFSILNLHKEPFSNSPDPDYFFDSQQHVSCLQKLELSLRLKRGLNVVIGEVGTGKTTLCRQLLRRFTEDADVETHLILDPYFGTPHEFLLTVAEALSGHKISAETEDYNLKEQIKHVLFAKGVDDNKTIVLIIDEGQKIPIFCLELLREFLNFETNDYKLLQIAIFAQKEFDQTLKEHANFADRINLYHVLKPMNFRDTRSMIQYRLNQSSGAANRLALFTYPALWAIYRATKGYPRKIVNLCHRSILTMIIQNKSKANWFLVQSCIRRVFSGGSRRSWQIAMAVIVLIVVGAVTIPRWLPTKTAIPIAKETTIQNEARPQKITQVLPPTNKAHATQQPNLVSNPKPSVEKQISTPTDQTLLAAAQPIPNSPDEIKQKVPQADESKQDGQHPVPGVLGQLKVVRRETVGGLIQTIYGVFNKSYLQSVVKVNPHITDPNTIDVGEIILFPAVPVHVNHQPLKRWWVEVKREDNLEDIIAFLRKYPTDAASTRLIPHWNRSTGLHFSVVLNQFFYDRSSAVNKLETFEREKKGQAAIISDWGNRTVFYADPFQNTKAQSG
jgi:general secretion pathway protein A